MECLLSRDGTEGNSFRVGTDRKRSLCSASHDTQSGRHLDSLNFSRDTALSSTAISEEPNMEPRQVTKMNKTWKISEKGGGGGGVSPRLASTSMNLWNTYLVAYLSENSIVDPR